MALVDPLQHQRLLGSIAASYLGRGLSEEDLVGEGQIGLLIACRDFNEARNRKFSTYASPKIHAAILRAIDDQVSLIHVPAHVHEMIRYKNSAYHKRYAAHLEAGKQALQWHVNEATLATKDIATTLSGIAQDYRSDPMDQRIAAHDLAILMADLSPRETQIIRLRYGLDGNGEMSLSEVGQVIGMVPQGVHRIEMKAMDKLRNKARTELRRAS